jgi:hypothetical protein
MRAFRYLAQAKDRFVEYIGFSKLFFNIVPFNALSPSSAAS